MQFKNLVAINRALELNCKYPVEQKRTESWRMELWATELARWVQ